MPLDHTGEEFNTDAHGLDFNAAHELVVKSGNDSLLRAFRKVENLLLQSGNAKQQIDVGIAVQAMYGGDTAVFDLIEKRAPHKPEYTPQINDSLAVLKAVLEDDCAQRKIKVHSSLKDASEIAHAKAIKPGE